MTEARVYVVSKHFDDGFTELLRVLTDQAQAEAFRDEAERADPRYEYDIRHIPFGWNGDPPPKYEPPPPRPLSPVERLLMQGAIEAVRHSMKNTEALLSWLDDTKHPSTKGGDTVTVRLPTRYGGGGHEGR